MRRDACRERIEDYALYGVRWADGFGESPFERTAIMPPDYKTVRYSGSVVIVFSLYLNFDSFVERPVRDGPWSARVSGREAPRAVGC